MNIYRVTRIVKEEADVAAVSKEAALAEIDADGANWDCTIIKTSAKKVGTE